MDFSKLEGIVAKRSLPPAGDEKKKKRRVKLHQVSPEPELEELTPALSDLDSSNGETSTSAKHAMKKQNKKKDKPVAAAESSQRACGSSMSKVSILYITGNVTRV